MKKILCLLCLSVFCFYGCGKKNADIDLLEAVKSCDTAKTVTALKAGANPNVKLYDVEGKENLGPVIMLSVYPCNNEKIVDLLLAAGADVNIKSYIGGTALNMAAGETVSERILKKLISNGANVNSTYNDGMNVLIDALVARNNTALKILLDAGVNPNVQSTKDGNTPLTIAAMSLKRYPQQKEAIKLLLAAGADAKIKNKKGKTAAMLAAESGDKNIAALLKKAENKQ